MNKLEIGNCLTIINTFAAKCPEIEVYNHGLDLGKLFSPELFKENETGSVSNLVKLFVDGKESIISFSYQEIQYRVEDELKYGCELFIGDMHIINIDFDLFEYLVKNKMNNYIMLKEIKNG